jgi:hypothetical protein
MGHFPPGTGGGEGIAHGRKGKGILIHRLTDAAAMPWSTRTTPANGDERAQVLPLWEAFRIRTGKRGRPRQRLKVLATDKWYDAKALRHRPRTRGSRPQIPTQVVNTMCVVPAEVPPLGGPLGTSRRLLQRVSHHRRDSPVGP